MTRRQLRDFLRRLGKTPEEVRQKLVKRGVKGRPYNSAYCPVANAIRQRCPGASVNVSVIARVGGEVVILPPPVDEFVGRFDARSYPELIAE